MSVLIKGMEIPKSRGEYALRMYVYSDGTAIIEGAYCRFEGEPFVAITVPPHGRLGDLDALAQLFKEKATEHGGIGGIMVAMAAGCIDAAPTIIPADPPKEET